MRAKKAVHHEESVRHGHVTVDAVLLIAVAAIILLGFLSRNKDTVNRTTQRAIAVLENGGQEPGWNDHTWDGGESGENEGGADDDGSANDGSPGGRGDDEPSDELSRAQRNRAKILLAEMEKLLGSFPPDGPFSRPKENIKDAIHVIRQDLQRDDVNMDRVRRMLNAIDESIRQLPDVSQGMATPPKEALIDYLIALELELSGRSDGLQAAWHRHRTRVELPGSAPAGERRFEGLMITGRLPFLVGEVTGTQVFLRDSTTGKIYEYQGVGAGGGEGAYLGWTFAPFEVDLHDPGDLPQVSASVGGVVGFFVGGGAGGNISQGDDGIQIDPDFSLALGIGASAGGGGTYLRYKGEGTTFIRRWLVGMFW